MSNIYKLFVVVDRGNKKQMQFDFLYSVMVATCLLSSGWHDSAPCEMWGTMGLYYGANEWKCGVVE